MKRILFSVFFVLVAVVVVESCGYDSSLREYLSRHFWLPFAHNTVPLERKNVRRVSVPYAGMDPINGGNGSLEALRMAYRQISRVDGIDPFVPSLTPQQALDRALADGSLSAAQREEVRLVEAKIEMRQGEMDGNDPATLARARQKFQAFLRSARNRAFASEARGWIARIDWLLGDQAAAGKIYLDELNRDGTNLSRDILLNSLHIIYGYDGGPELRSHIAEYFDTPEHAAFGIQLVTNPHSRRTAEEAKSDVTVYTAIMRLAEQNRRLFDSASRAETLTLLLIRTALRMGDLENALKIVEMVPKDSTLLENADLNWMSAAVHFLMRDYRSAEAPLLKMFRSEKSSRDDKAAAAYGLVGVYQKLNDPIEQLHYVLWLRAQQTEPGSPWQSPAGSEIEDRTLYWAPSSWDLGTLLDYQIPTETLAEFINRYPDVSHVRLVRYALAVRLARADRYTDAAEIYASIGADRRAARMRQLADLFTQANDAGATEQQRMEGQYRFAEYLSNNSERVYFNDTLWDHFQNHALTADSDFRLTKEEHDTFVSGERDLRDSQEERWRAYLILNGIVERAGKTSLGRNAARLALRCLRGIAVQRFGREDMIEQADNRLSNWLRR